MADRIIAVLNRLVPTCWAWVRDDECRLPRGHRTTHQARPTLREWWNGWRRRQRPGDCE